MIQIIQGADYSGSGLDNIISPLPRLGGALFATYLPGTGWNGEERAAHDYSGQRGDLILNQAPISLLGVGAVAVDNAKTPFTAAELASGTGEMTWLGVVKVPTGATITPLFNSGTTNPYAALHLSPGGNNIAAFKVDGAGAVQANFPFDPSIKGLYAFAHGRWTSTSVKAGIVRPGAGWVGSAGYAELASNKAFINALPIRVLVVDGEVVGDPEMSIGGFYTGALSDDDLELVYSACKKVMALKGVSI